MLSPLENFNTMLECHLYEDAVLSMDIEQMVTVHAVICPTKMGFAIRYFLRRMCECAGGTVQPWTVCVPTKDGAMPDAAALWAYQEVVRQTHNYIEANGGRHRERS